MLTQWYPEVRDNKKLRPVRTTLIYLTDKVVTILLNICVSDLPPYLSLESSRREALILFGDILRVFQTIGFDLCYPGQNFLDIWIDNSHLRRNRGKSPSIFWNADWSPTHRINNIAKNIPPPSLVVRKIQILTKPFPF